MLTRRGLIAAAGLLASAPLQPSAAQEQWPPDGYRFCEQCEPEGWQERFGAYHIPEHERCRYNVSVNGVWHRYAMAVKLGTDGWVAQLVNEPNDPYFDLPEARLRPCACGSRVDPFPLMIVYGDVQLVTYQPQEA